LQPRRTYATNICIETVRSRSKGFNIIFSLHELQNYFYVKTSLGAEKQPYVSVVTVTTYPLTKVILSVPFSDHPRLHG